jgi:hypothetical protein
LLLLLLAAPLCEKEREREREREGESEREREREEEDGKGGECGVRGGAGPLWRSNWEMGASFWRSKVGWAS